MQESVRSKLFSQLLDAAGWLLQKLCLACLPHIWLPGGCQRQSATQQRQSTIEGEWKHTWSTNTCEVGALLAHLVPVSTHFFVLCSPPFQHQLRAPGTCCRTRPPTTPATSPARPSSAPGARRGGRIARGGCSSWQVQVQQFPRVGCTHLAVKVHFTSVLIIYK